MRQTKYLHIFEMLLVCALGLTLILSPKESFKTAFVILGIALIAGGALAEAYYMIKRGKAEAHQQLLMIAVAGCVAIVAGLIMILAPKLIEGLFRFAAGILVAFSGILNMIKAMDVKREGGKNWGILLLLSLVTIGLGVFIFINPFAWVSGLVIMVGAVLIYNGVLGIIAAVQE